MPPFKHVSTATFAMDAGTYHIWKTNCKNYNFVSVDKATTARPPRPPTAAKAIPRLIVVNGSTLVATLPPLLQKTVEDTIPVIEVTMGTQVLAGSVREIQA
jgi:hypothetical protein